MRAIKRGNTIPRDKPSNRAFLPYVGAVTERIGGILPTEMSKLNKEIRSVSQGQT